MEAQPSWVADALKFHGAGGCYAKVAEATIAVVERTCMGTSCDYRMDAARIRYMRPTDSICRAGILKIESGNRILL